MGHEDMASFEKLRHNTVGIQKLGKIYIHTIIYFTFTLNFKIVNNYQNQKHI